MMAWSSQTMGCKALEVHPKSSRFWMQIQRSTAFVEEWLRGLLRNSSDERGSRAFCAPRWDISTQCVSYLFPLSAVLSSVSPSMFRSFLPMCFSVGSVLHLSHSLAFIDISCLCGSPSFKRFLRNSGFGWISSNESRRSWSISSSIK
jgi:hypothetical protein